MKDDKESRQAELPETQPGHGQLPGRPEAAPPRGVPMGFRWGCPWGEVNYTQLEVGQSAGGRAIVACPECGRHGEPRKTSDNYSHLGKWTYIHLTQMQRTPQGFWRVQVIDKCRSHALVVAK